MDNASRMCSIGKFQLLGVATVFALLLLVLNNEHETKKGLVRRKSALLESVRTLKEAKQEVESKLEKAKLEVEEKIKQLAENKKEMEGYKNDLKTKTTLVNEKDAELKKLQKTAVSIYAVNN